jgi:NADPH-dependent 2,4-dienoyl-CoA reductase/sulfur reductase-like enzyme
MHLGTTIVALDTGARTVTDAHGRDYRYGKLLLATGGTPRRLGFPDPGVIYLRTLDDYDLLRASAVDGAEAAVIGGGFIGAEIAAALTLNGARVTMIFPERALGANNYPRSLSDFLTGYYREKGVSVLANTSVAAIEPRAKKTVVSTADGSLVSADTVAAGIGIVPRVDLAEKAGLKVDNGIVVDRLLRTSDSSVYAAGDVANFESEALGRRVRVEHEDNANNMGKLAGQNMAGQEATYKYLPFFYSDLFDLGYEAIGELDARHEMVEDWVEPYTKGVVYYMKEGLVRGVLLWNTWGQVEAARELIAGHGKFEPRSLIGRISD